MTATLQVTTKSEVRIMDANALRGEIKRCGLTQEKVAMLIGMSPKTFSLKLKRGVFGIDEAERMIELLQIKDPVAIFFNKKVT